MCQSVCLPMNWISRKISWFYISNYTQVGEKTIFYFWALFSKRIWVIPCKNKEKKGQRQKFTFLWRNMKEYMVMRVFVGSFSISFVFGKALNHFFLFLKMDRFQKAHIAKYFFLHWICYCRTWWFFGLIILFKFFGHSLTVLGVLTHFNIAKKNHISKTLAVFKI